MNPEEVIEVEMEDGVRLTAKVPRAAVEVEVVRSEEKVPEEPKNYWEQNGFLREIARVCEDLEGEREKFLFNSEVRRIIETINNAQAVEDFDRYTDSQLQEFVQTLRNRVPQIEREVVGFINQLTRARSVQVDSVDFI